MSNQRKSKQELRLEVLQQDLIRDDAVLAVMSISRGSYLLLYGNIITRDEIDTFFSDAKGDSHE
jgi:hypothetical protein